MRRHKTNDPAELRRETHRRRVLAYMEKAVSEGRKPRSQVGQTAAQKLPLIGEARRAATVTKPPQARSKPKTRAPKAAQLDLGV